MEHAPALYGFAYARLRDHHLAQDLVQDALVAAWKSWANYQGGSSLLTWLTGILRHKILDHHRSTARRPQLSSAPDGDTTAAEGDLFTVCRGFQKQMLSLTALVRMSVATREAEQPDPDFLRAVRQELTRVAGDSDQNGPSTNA